MLSRFIKIIGLFFITLTVVIALSVVIAGGTAIASPGADGFAWQLSQHFRTAMNDLEQRNQQYIWLWLALLLLLAGLIVFAYRAQRKSISQIKSFQVSDTGSSSQRGLMRLSLEQEAFYAHANNTKYRRINIINISGSGLLFSTNAGIQQNDELKFVIELFPDEEILKLRARVVHVIENSGPDSEKYFMVGVQFLNITKRDQDKIMKKVLQKQQGTILEEKRKSKNQCVFCGEPLPEEAKGVKLYCPKCSVFIGEK